jgi:CO/xanthine dehydrogenase FAD-binding subunit
MNGGLALPYLAPSHRDQALAFLVAKSPRIIAGCTDYYPGLQQGHHDEDVLDISRISGLRGISQTPSGWRIGAATTWTDVVRTPLPAAFDGLKQAAREVGSIQIQNRGTVAGNICNASPAADGVPPLLTLDAQIEIASVAGNRMVPLADFITGVRQIALTRDEMVVAIQIPEIAETCQSSFIKLGSRKYLVISIAMVAVAVRLDQGRIADLKIAVGSCSPVAKRLPGLEARLHGASIDDLASLDFGGQDYLAPLTPISDVRGSSDYRLDIVAEICRRSVIDACARG